MTSETTSPYTILLQLQADLPAPNRVQREALEHAASHVLLMENLQEGTMLSVVISTNEHIQDLNLKFRGIDAPTDILSFDADPLPEEMREEDDAPTGQYLGDIVIGLPYVATRALNTGHSVHDELMLLVVHGTLHLLGYDHDSADAQREMWAIQAQALADLGIALQVPDFIHEA